MAKELALQQGPRERPAVDRQVGVLIDVKPARILLLLDGAGLPVDSLGNQFLAGPRLALDQDRGGQFRHLFDELPDRLDLPILAYHHPTLVGEFPAP